MISINPPPLAFAQRPSFHDADGISNTSFALFVVGHKLGSLFHKLPVNGMFDLPLYHDGDGLIHLVAGDFADPFLAQVTALRGIYLSAHAAY
jgi:hypothetical protein